MKVLININEPNKHLYEVSDECGVSETEYGFLLSTSTQSFGRGDWLTRHIFLEDKQNYKWIQK